MTRKIRVLVVDDSASVRSIFCRRLAADPEIEVVDHAADGLEAIQKVRDLRPDVVTMDVEMPRMDGLEAVQHIMRESPRPIVMVSALTRAGADVTIRALELGAVDFVLKPTRGGLPAVHEVTDELCAKIKLVAEARVAGPAGAVDDTDDRSSHDPSPSQDLPWLDKVVVIGSSTGGPQALCQVLSSFPNDTAVPVLLVQHMPAGFTRSLAERLNGLSPLQVEEARPGTPLEPGRALLAPGGLHMIATKSHRVGLHTGPPECGVRPSINVTMESVAAVFGASAVGVVLTGMGSDGTRGAGLIKAAGGEVVAQDAATCVVYGMPKSVAEAGYVDSVVPLPRVASEIVCRCRARRSGKESVSWTRLSTPTSSVRSASS